MNIPMSGILLVIKRKLLAQPSREPCWSGHSNVHLQDMHRPKCTLPILFRATVLYSRFQEGARHLVDGRKSNVIRGPD